MSTDFCSELQAMAERQELTLHQKMYEPGDLAGAFVVVATVTYDPQLAEAIWNEAQERGQLINIVDVPARCTFIVPSILRRGQLTIAVSTEGAAPSLSKHPGIWKSYFQLPMIGTCKSRLLPVCIYGNRVFRNDKRDAFFSDFSLKYIVTSC